MTTEERVVAAVPGRAPLGPSWLRPLLFVVFVVALVTTVALCWRFMAKEGAFQDDIETRAQIAALKGSKALSSKLMSVEKELSDLAKGRVPADRAAAESTILRLLDSDKDLTAVGFVAPDAKGDPEKRPATIGVRQPDGKVIMMQGESRRATPGWLEPYYRQEVGQRVAEFSVATGGSGMFFADLGVTSIARLVADLEIGSPGYSFVVSAEKGRVLSYPVSEFVGQKQDLSKLAVREQEPAYEKLASQVKAADAGHFKAVSGRTNSNYWIAFQRVSQTGWQYVVRLAAELPSAAAQISKRDRIQIVIALLVTILAGLAALFKVNDTNRNELWTFCLSSAAALLVGTGCIFYLIMDTPASVKSDADIMLTDQGELLRYVSQDPYATGKLTFQKPHMIKTGLHIQSVDFAGANNISLTGTVWQQIPDAIKDQVRIGVYFPEAVKSDLRESYVRKSPDGLTHGWTFAVTFRQAFDFTRYPLDTQNVRMRMRSTDFDKNIILVPDLEAYGTWDQNDVPGVDIAAVLNGWVFDRTFFDFTKARYKSNFGITNLVGQSGFPELRFNALLRRDFKGPMVSVVLPMAIISTLLFMNLMFAKVDDKPLSILSPIAAFFFSVALAHAKIRDTFATGDFMFMEMFCFALYFMIVYVALTLLVRSTQKGPSKMIENDGLVPKLLYWPVLGSILFISAVGVYYA